METELKPLFRQEEEIKPLFKENFGVNLNLFRPWNTDKIEIRKSELPMIKPDLYGVTNHGDVYNIQSKKKMKIHLNNKRYPTVGLIKDPKYTELKYHAKPINVHRMIAHAFIENDDESKDFVNHIDGSRDNNYYENLEWTDNSGNQLHAYDIGLNKYIGENALLHRTFSEKQIHKMCEMLSKGYSVVEIMNHYGFKGKTENPSLYRQIYRLKSREGWRHITKLYDY